MAEIKIIGTSHIARQSVEEVRKAILEFRPGIVAVELDHQRYLALVSGKKKGITIRDIKYIGIKGFIFALIGEYVEKKIGKMVGTKPGADMLSAIKTAEQMHIPVALIDQNIDETLRNLSKSLSWKEKWKIFIDIIKGLILGKRELKKLGIKKIDLSRVPEKDTIKKLMTIAKKRYPNLYKVIVTDRNIYMSNMIVNLARSNPDKNILAVVGAGHEETIKKLIRKTNEH